MTVRKVDPHDWRRQGQESYLRGRTLRQQVYRPYRPGWDHDHCEFCGRKFSLAATDLQSGYSAAGAYHWICSDCYDDFCDEFEWKVESA